MIQEPTLAEPGADPSAAGEEVPLPRAEEEKLEQSLPAPQGGDDADIPDRVPAGRPGL
jgi:hypothetical protein